MLKKLQNVYLPIDKFQAKVFKNSDLSKRGEWVSNFALSLAGESNDDFAEELLTEAQVSFYKEKVRKWKHYIKNVLCNENEGVIPTENEIYTRCCEEYGDEFVEAVELVESNLKKNKKTRKNPQDAPNGNAGVDGKSRTSCDQFTADVDIREDSKAVTDGSAITRNETRANDALEPSANNCGPRQAKNGDASHREAEDESANVSNPFALDMPGLDKGEQSAKTRDSRGSGRYQPPSLGPEDGNLFTTKNPSTISANGRHTGGPSLSQTSSLPPVRQAEPDVLSLAYSGEFGNVRLSQAQYNELGIRFGNLAKLNRAIDSLSCKIENGETNPRNHYAELVKWANYRDDMDEAEEVKAAKQPRYETVSEHNARIVAEGKKWIDEHFPKKDKKNG